MVLKSAPKQLKLIDSIEKDMRELNDRKNYMNNGNYVMPKIFCINLDADR